MHVLIATIGSHGDVHPFVGIGQALRRRGHEVSFLVQPYFRRLVEEARFDFIPVGERFDLIELANRPELMSTNGSAHIIRGLMIPDVPNQFAATRAAIDRLKPGAILAHHLCFGAPWAAQERGIPCAVACLSPLMWLAKDDPCVYMPVVSQHPKRWAVKAQRKIGKVVSGWLYDGPLHKHRANLGLPRGRGFLMGAVTGAEAALGLWSPHFRAPFPDDPGHGHVCGFVWFDRDREQEAPAADLQRFLDDGDPPVIFTLGTTAVHVAGPFYEAAAGACRILGRRGLLLTGRPEYAPRDLPPDIRAFTYAPYTTVLPRGSATVHHGGIGTTAQSMRAGRPTVIVPFAHDQFDNASRAWRLGVSQTVPRKRVSAMVLAAALRTVLDDPAYAARAAALGRRIGADEGAETAAERILALARRRN